MKGGHVLRGATKTLAAVLAVVVALVMCAPVPVWAEELQPEGVCGTCGWVIDDTGLLRIYPTDDENGELEGEFGWSEHADEIVTAVVEADVSATTLADLFNGCVNLTTADLTGLDAVAVTDMSRMFFGCTSLRTVFVGDTWSTESVVESADMFTECAIIAGGLGTTYDPDHVDATFAHVDAEDNPGYFVAAGEEPVHAPGWANEDGAFRYFELNGSMRTSAWVEDDGACYYVDEDGKALSNTWLNIDDAWYYIAANGRAVFDGWITYKGMRFYLNDLGNPVPNTWFKYGGYYFYLGVYGQLVKSSWIKSGGTYYYLGKYGQLVTSSWVKSGGTYYYVGKTGRPVTSSWIKTNGVYYYVGKTGKLATSSWIKTNGAYYYVGKSGKLITSSWIRTNGTYYYVGSSGKALSGRWILVSGVYYYLDSRGRLVTNGWASYNGDYYYMGSSGAAIKNSWINYGGRSYYVDGSGRMLSDQWLQEYGTFYYFCSDGYWTDTRVYTASGSLKDLYIACYTTPSTGAAGCASWVTNVFSNAGIGWWSGNASDMYSMWCVSSDLAELKPGMIIAVKSTYGSAAALRSGHVGIYLGYGYVAHNLSGEVGVMDLNSWIASFGGLSTPRWGWFGAIVLS